MLRASAHSRERGFSLLEAIVAMTLVAIAGMALFTWINTSFESIRRIEASNARAEAELNALEWIKTVNPMERPNGVERIGALSIQWRSQVIVAPQSALGELGDPGAFVVALYETRVTVEQPPSVPAFEFVVRQTGYRRTTPPVSL